MSTVYGKFKYGDVWHVMFGSRAGTECGRVLMGGTYRGSLGSRSRLCQLCSAFEQPRVLSSRGSPEHWPPNAVDVNSTFSNFQSSPIELDGLTYPTVEHYFQSMKMAHPEDAELIRTCSGPGAAKTIGRRLPMRPDWPEVRVGVMRRALRAKFEPGSELAERLLATDTRPLVEWNSWHDQIWGQCECGLCRGTRGQNLLGLLLAEVRAELVEGHRIIADGAVAR